MQETQLQQKEILAEKKENISKKSMHKKIILISFISILGIFLLIVGFYVGSKYSLRDSSDPVKLSFENIGKLATQSAHETMINEINDASLAFDNKREDNLREKLAEERKEKAEYAKKVGQLTMQVDWLKKNLKKLSDLTTRVNLVRNPLTTKELSVSTGAKLLGINRTSVYYGGTPVSEEDLVCRAIIDHLHTDNPTWGARQMSAQLKLRGYQVGRRKVGRYMREMDITPIYPKINLSKRVKQAKVCPYLLRNAVILTISSLASALNITDKTRSSSVTPKYSDKLIIFDNSGSLAPASHIPTAVLVTPSFSANSLCFIPI